MDKTSAIFCAATVVLWGLWALLGKIALDRGMPPLAVLGIETVSSLLCVGLVLAGAKMGLAPTAFSGSWNWFGVLSGLSLAGGLLFYYLALNRAQVTLIVPLTSTYPVAAAVLSIVFLRERLMPWQWAGLVLVVIGTFLLLIDSKPQPSTASSTVHQAP